MTSPDQRGVTQLLIDLSNGDREALDQLLPLVYEELRRQAKSYMRRERSDHTLQSTALVHETYLRLVDQTRVQWKNRAHFFGVAAQLMRRIVVKHAEKRRTAKRGGEVRKVSLDEAVVLSTERAAEMIALDKALTRLTTLDPQLGRVVELRFFGGLTIEETAEVLEVSPATIKREWRTAKAWLHRDLEK